MKEFEVSTEMMDVEIIYISEVNVLARGRRYGKWWLLKGLIEQRRDSPIDRHRLQKEFEIHSRLLDPGIAQAVSFEEIKGLGHCIVEEWVEGKNLLELLKAGQLSKKERRKIMREIISIVGYIHSRGVAHRNLKPSNIMVRDVGDGVVVTDFGLADTDGYGDDIYGLGMIMEELCPEYGGIAARCTGPAKKRPKDTVKLLKSLAHRDRVPKVIWSILGAAVFIGCGVIMGLFFHSLNSTSIDAREKVLALSETTHLQERRVVGLTDSLTGVTGRINKVQEEIKGMDSYIEMRKNIFAMACHKIDKLFEDFEKNVVPMFEKDYPAFYDSISVLYDKSRYICNTVRNPKRFPDLNENDALEMYNNLIGYYENKFTYEIMIWKAMINNSDFDNSNNMATPEQIKILSDRLAAKRAAGESKKKKSEQGEERKKDEKKN